MKKIRLGVNIDHVATVRNARGEKYPSPLRAAILAEKYGADSVTIHLREDRRHINDNDLKSINSKLKIPLNLEIAATNEMLKIALRYKTPFVCIVPEKREELTTEGGLDLFSNPNALKKFIFDLKSRHIKVSLFIDPDLKQVKQAHVLKTDSIELHTGRYSREFKSDELRELDRIVKSAHYAETLQLAIHAGHGLNFDNVRHILAIGSIEELNIGHSLVSEALFCGIYESVAKIKKILEGY